MIICCIYRNNQNSNKRARHNDEEVEELELSETELEDERANPNKKSSSIAWDHFDRIKDSRNIEYAKCHYCM